MPVIPARPTVLAPEPSEHLVYPWRFTLGQHIYALGHINSVQVIGGELWMSFPHLQCADWSGKTWRIPQIHCSARPILSSTS